MFKLERKIDIISLIALAIAVITATWQVKDYLVGARVKCIAPKQILIFAANRGSSTNLHLNANLTYINDGAKGYSDVIVEEKIKFEISGKSYELQWQKFGHSQRAKEDPTRLEFIEKEDAAPFGIDGGMVITHETNFQPTLVDRPGVDRRINFLSYDDFLREIQNIDEIAFQVSYETVSGKKSTASCLVKLDAKIKRELAERFWSAPTCSSFEQTSSVAKKKQF